MVSDGKEIGRALKAVVANRNSPQKHAWRAKIVPLTADGHGTAANCPAVGETGYRFLAAARCKHQVYTGGKRARSWDRPQRHAVLSYKPGGGLDPGGDAHSGDRWRTVA